MQEWQADFFKVTPIFNDLKHLLANVSWRDWPTCQSLNSLLSNDIVNHQGDALTLVEQTDELLSDGIYYEQRIYEQGVVPTRAGNWHDFFNAMIYLLFPRTKKEMNRLHVQEMKHFGTHKRSPCRDAITLLDECGVIVAYTDDTLASALKNHHWQHAFVTNRSAWGNSISAVVIGHANYEKSLSPYIGFTGKALYLKVTSEFFSLDMWAKYHYLDTMLAENIERLLQNNSQLFPLPMLGVPGWWPANTDQCFYDNEKYFRPKRQRS